jgi:hypothetical protein
VPATQLTERDRRDLADRSHGMCEVCSQRRAAQAHHRQPRGMGGSRLRTKHALANLLHVCSDCHAKIESNRTVAEHNGWLVPLGISPDDAPVYLRVPWASWFMLGEDTVPMPMHSAVAVQIEELY